MRVDSPLIHQIHVHQLVAHFVGRVVQKQVDFLAALGYSLEDQRKAVPAQNREQQGDFAGKLLVDVFGDRRNRRVISLCPCDDRFGDADHITVAILKAVLCGGFQQRIDDHRGDVIPLLDDRRPDSPDNGSHCPTHSELPFAFDLITRFVYRLFLFFTMARNCLIPPTPLIMRLIFSCSSWRALRPW